MTERGAARLAWALSVGAHLALFVGLWALANRNPHRPEPLPSITFALLDPDEAVVESASVPAEPPGRPPTLVPMPAAIPPLVADLMRRPADRPAVVAPVQDPVEDVVRDIVTVGYESAPVTTTDAIEVHEARPVSDSPPGTTGAASSPRHSALSEGGERRPGPSGAAPVHGPLPAGIIIAYVLDCSGTMGLDGMLGRARSALLATLAAQPAGVRVVVVTYSGRAEPLLPGGPTELSDPLRERIARALALLEPAGDSRHAEGLRVALLFRPDHVLLLTDADDGELSEVRPVLAGARKPVSAAWARVTADTVEPPRPLR